MGLRAGLLPLILLAGCAGREAVMIGPKPIGPYSPAIVQGGTVYVAGQGPSDPKAGIRDATRQTLDKVKAILEAAGSSLEKVSKVNVYLSDLDNFAAMNEVYRTYFKEPYPARTTIQAAALPGGIPIEIDCVASR
jgi:2-iminobutanoate/2-iminopropanoate deaminase